MSEPTVWLMGSKCDLAKLVRHYRAMGHREPNKIHFWRTVLRGVIDTYRRQAAEGQQRKVA